MDMGVWRQRGRIAGALGVIVAAVALPSTAAAHGPVDPAASSYVARLGSVPAGIEAKVIDGDQRLWLRVSPGRTVVVIDYQGAPYLRFSPRGVAVNTASAMYYLNQVPAETPPATTGPRVAPHWSAVSGAHTYGWHDGRLHALAATAPAPGATYLGRWRVPLRIDGVPSAITGGLYFAASPSIVWFWPILVALACAAAVLRLRRPELDERLARGLAAVALAGFAVAVTGQQLHGRPSVSVGQGVLLAAALAFAAWAAWRLARRRHGWFTFFLIAALAIWEGASLIAVLLDGYVLMALPAAPGAGGGGGVPERRGGTAPGGVRAGRALGPQTGRDAGPRSARRRRRRCAGRGRRGVADRRLVAPAALALAAGDRRVRLLGAAAVRVERDPRRADRAVAADRPRRRVSPARARARVRGRAEAGWASAAVRMWSCSRATASCSWPPESGSVARSRGPGDGSPGRAATAIS